MQPTLLKLENFLSYQEALVPLGDIRLAALLGDNGGGKSSLLDALTWGLYGQGRYQDLDHYIHQGREQARVEVHFRHQGEDYRVTRTRTLRGRGKSTLDLARQVPGGWQPLSGPTLRQTQEKIRELLRLDYDSFASTCFILQGQSGRFCAAPPGERKKILGQVLGLDTYPRLQQCAKARAREYREKALVHRGQAGLLDQELSHLPHWEGEAAGAARELRAIQEEAAWLQREKAYLEKEARLQERALDRKEALRQQADTLEQEARQHRETLREIRGQERDTGDLEALQARLDDLSQSLAQKGQGLARQEEEYRGTRVLADNYPALLEGQERLQQQLLLCQQQQQALEGQALRHREALSQESRVRAQAQLARETQGALDQKDRQALEDRGLRDALQKASQDLALAKQRQQDQLKSLRQEQEAARQKAALLEKVDCRRRDCPFLEDAFRARDTLGHLQHRLGQAQAGDSVTGTTGQARPGHAGERGTAAPGPGGNLPVGGDLTPPTPGGLERAARDLQGQLEALGYCPEAHARLRQRARELAPYLAQEEKLQGARQQLAALQEQQGQWQEHHRQLQARAGDTRGLEESARAAQDLGRQERRLRVARQEISQLREEQGELEKELARLHYARGQAAALRDRAREAWAGLHLRESQLQQLRAEDHLLGDPGPRLTHLRGLLRQQEKALQALHRQHQVQKEKETRAAQRLEDLAQKARDREEQKRAGQAASREQYLYETLAGALGRDGIPALIIENALPALQDHANHLLGRLTGGRLSLRLETRKEAKTTGKPGETLEVILGDHLGERPYEGWSGAERFGVDISLRLAVSRLLAQRAGASIETLVIDEGASCLDPSAREKFVQAVDHIAQDFASIIVITHIDQLKEAFPQQIRVEKTPAGSRVEVIA